MLQIKDDRKQEFFFARPPRRVVSLVPSETLTLFDLGVADKLVGRTRYCIEPAGAVDDIEICGGTKDVDVANVIDLAPDLVLANQEENTRPAMLAIKEAGIPVFISFPRRVVDGVGLVARLARIFGVAGEPAVTDLVRRGYAAVKEARTEAVRGAFIPIWMDPLMTINGNTFGSDMLALAGVSNIFADRERKRPLAADYGMRGPLPSADRDTRYPRVTMDEVASRSPSIVVLPDEPYDFDEQDAALFRERLGVEVRMCDGKDVFWYGSRIAEALPRLRAALA